MEKHVKLRRMNIQEKIVIKKNNNNNKYIVYI